MLTKEDIARIAHEVNRAYCLATETEGHPPWDEAPDWQRESAIDGVLHYLVTPRTPEQQHALWMSDKLRAGWKLGIVKDAEQKTHPCLVPYDQLPPHQRVKDHLFIAVVAACKVIRDRQRSNREQ